LGYDNIYRCELYLRVGVPAGKLEKIHPCRTQYEAVAWRRFYVHFYLIVTQSAWILLLMGVNIVGDFDFLSPGSHYNSNTHS
jgi:hypothetical protein